MPLLTDSVAGIDTPTIVLGLLGAVLAVAWAYVQVAVLGRLKRIDRLLTGDDGTGGLAERVRALEAADKQREAVRAALEASAHKAQLAQGSLDALVDLLRRRAAEEGEEE